MGKIRGDLDVLGLAQLLQALDHNRREGMLAVFAQNDRKVIHIASAGLRVMATTKRRTNSIGEILLRTGKITRLQIQEMLEEQKVAGRRLGEIVASRGLLSKEDIEGALRDQALEEIYDLFTWKAAQFEFTDAPRPPEPESPLGEVFVGINVPSITLEAARRLDELERIRKVIPDGRIVLAKAGEARLDDPNLDRAVAEAVLPLVDGTLAVADLVEAALYPAFQVLRALFVLATQGALKVQGRGAKTARRIAEATTVILPGALPPRKSVLVLSGMPLFLSAVAGRLRQAGLEVYEESRPDQVDAALARHRPDAAIVDLSVDGEDPIGLLAEVFVAARVPFIVLSANASREAVVAAIKSGARDYLVKPITDTVLLQRLTTLLL